MGEKKKDKTIFYLSNSFNLNTGYAKCVRNFCKRLSPYYNVAHIGQQSYGNPFEPKGWGFQVHPFYDDGKVLLSSQISAMKPSAIIVQDDLFTMVKKGLADIDYAGTNLILYPAIDGDPLSTIAYKILDKADKIVAMTDWGKGVLERAGYEDIDVVYHGVDTELWKPLKDKGKHRVQVQNLLKKVWEREFDFKDKFLILGAGRNTLRKNFSDLILSFAKFAKDKDDVYLLLNSVNYKREDMNLTDFVKRVVPQVLGEEYKGLLYNKIGFFPAQSFQRGVPEKQMKNLVGCCDVHASTSFGEGFGLFILESMACGVPVISSNYTTPKELIGEKRGFLVESNRKLFTNWGIAHDLVDKKEFVDKLDEAYNLWKKDELREKYEKPCREFALKYDWDKVSPEWKKIIEEVTL